MLRHARPPLLVLGLLLGSAAWSAAQTSPVPILPPEAPEDQPSNDPASPAAAPTSATVDLAPSSSWSYSFDVGLGWESNAGLNRLTDAPSDYVGNLAAGLTRQARTARGSYELSLSASGFGYAEQKDYNRLDGAFEIDAQRRLSTKTSGTLGAGISYGHTDNSEVLSDQGLLLPLTRAVGYAADLGVSHAFSPRTSLDASLRGYRTDFPDSALETGSSVRFALGLAQQTGVHTTVGAQYGIERARAYRPLSNEPVDPGAYWTHYLSGELQRTLSAYTSVRLEAGGSYTLDAESSGLGQAYNFYGGIGLARRIKRSSLSGYYRREVLPAFGVGGLRATNRVGLDLASPLGRAWEMVVAGSYSRGAAGGAGEEPLSYADARLRVGRSLGQKASLALAGSYAYQSAYGLLPSIDNYRIGLVFSLGSRLGGAQFAGF